MRFLKWVLILPLLAYGGAHGYLWYKTKSAADKAVEQMAMFADLRYEGVHVSVHDATVGLDKVEIQPKMGGNDTVSIGQIRFSLPNALYFLKAGDDFNGDNFPEWMAVSIHALEVDLTSETVAMFAQAEQTSQNNLGSELFGFLARSETLGCGEVEQIGLKEAIAMGYDDVVADIDMKIAVDKVAGNIDVAMQVRDRSLFAVDMGVEMAIDPAMVAGVATGAVPPRISRIEFVYEDGGYYDLRNLFCARERGESVEAYLDANSHLVQQSLGGALSEQQLAAYRAFMAEGGKVSLRMIPSEPLEPTGLELYSEDDLMRLLGASLEVNGTPFDLVALAGQSGLERLAEERPTAPTVAKRDVQQQTRARPKPKASTSVRKRYVEVDRFELKGYIDRKLQVDISGRGIREGVLESVDNELIYILMTLRGGTISYPIRIADIRKVSVWK